MNNITRIVSLIGILAISQIAYSAGGGKDIAPGQKGSFSGFGMGFSALGAPKNVRVMSSGATNYNLSIQYESSTDEVSIDGVSTPRPFFAAFPFVATDGGGNVFSVNNFIETPDTEDYIIYNIEESSYDNTGNKISPVDDDTLRESFECKGGSLQICLATVTLSLTDAFQDNYTRTTARSLTGPFRVNGMTFNEVRVDNQLGNDRLRIRAKGIGEVFRSQPGRDDRKLIYYRANGVTEGSLDGTPFAVGGVLHGIFFTPTP